MSDDCCNIHYIDLLNCAYCVLLDKFDYSLICKFHLRTILCCKDCVRILNNHNNINQKNPKKDN